MGVLFILIGEMVPGSRAFKRATRGVIWRCCCQYDLRSDGASCQIFDFVGLIKALEGRRW